MYQNQHETFLKTFHCIMNIWVKPNSFVRIFCFKKNFYLWRRSRGGGFYMIESSRCRGRIILRILHQIGWICWRCSCAVYRVGQYQVTKTTLFRITYFKLCIIYTIGGKKWWLEWLSLYNHLLTKWRPM